MILNKVGKHLLTGLFSIQLCSVFGQMANASQELPDSLFQNLPLVEISDTRDTLQSRVAGSLTVIKEPIFKAIQPITAAEILRRSPGVHVVEEEGAGLRTNISIRGLDPDRSRTVLVLEDGIPVALNPYGEPELYYSPAIDRMQRVEIIKGSGQILYGPQSIGGVVNYITAPIPNGQEGFARIEGGSGGFFRGLLTYGKGTHDRGYQLTVLRKQADELGYARFRVNDVNAKLMLPSGKNGRLFLKVGVYDEVSNSTYIGLTQNMWESQENWFVQMAPDDNLSVRRYSLSAKQQWKLSEEVTAEVLAYGYTTTRNWQRQEFSFNPLASNQTGVIWGDTTVAGGAVYMLDQNLHRNRQFEVAAVEPRISAKHGLFGARNELHAGARFLYERAFEQLVAGSSADARSGLTREDEIRTGYGSSIYLQNKIDISSNFSVTPGIRFEHFDYEREIFRGVYNSQIVDTQIVASRIVQEFIPGFGANYTLNSKATIFAGAHRGFAPPRIKDAITKEGVAELLEAELSWNYEVGTRVVVGEFIFAEITGFLLDFSNQIIPVSQSSGGLGTGQINGGRTRHTGVEAGVSFTRRNINNTAFGVDVNLNATVLNAEYSADRFLEDSDNTVNINGNTLPYAPELQVNALVSLFLPSNIQLNLAGNYVGEQFADELNTVQASANGRVGEIADYLILDVSASWGITEKLAVRAAVKNIMDESFIVSRRPQGIRVGLGRFISAGFSYSF